jgi:hypothetical protein
MVERSLTPPAPTFGMVDRRLTPPAPPFGMQYGMPETRPYSNSAPAYEHPISYEQYSGFGPGQVMNNSPTNSVMPLLRNASYAPSPFSPVVPPVSGLGSNQQLDGGDIAPVLTRQPSAETQLTRQVSSGMKDHQFYNAASGLAPHEVNYPAPVVIASRQSSGSSSSAEYVDLNRASVTPFQATQYIEISKKLNTEVPNGLGTPMDNQGLNSPPVPPKDDPSPFADPIPSSLQPAGYPRESIMNGQDIDRPISAYSLSTVSVVHALDFPEPPSPALTVASRFRVDASPPTLPEINLESRNSVHSLGSEFTSGAKGLGPRPPVAPSPLATSLTYSPPTNTDSLPVIPAPPAPVTVGSAVETQELKRPETVYNPEDAYGGI